MSFICGLCAIYTQPREKATRIVIETREAVYPRRENANTFVKEGKKEMSDDPGGRGWEIVKEVFACGPCARARQEAQQL